ncbi:pentapeptide repeat-containing protein [Leucobacter sp. Z1108]|uniref:pentapeptide repeat-containing protein n=1 Tax=Leucobacter sp. Z1108 TaxID=3439066 RepID=UPI003F31B6BC
MRLARLRLARLRLARLRHARLRHARLRHARLRHARLRHARLRHARLRHTLCGSLSAARSTAHVGSALAHDMVSSSGRAPLAASQATKQPLAPDARAYRTHREWGRRHKCPYGWTSCAVCAHPPVTPQCSTYQMTEGQFSSKRRISSGRTGHIVDPRSSATSLTQV